MLKSLIVLLLLGGLPCFAATKRTSQIPAVVSGYSFGILAMNGAMKSALEDLNQKLASYRDVEITAPSVSFSSNEIVICVALNKMEED